MVILETSRATVNIARGAAPTADIVLGTIGGALQTGGVSIDLLDSDPTNIQVGITMVHDATGTTALEYTHAEIVVPRGAAIDLDNVFDVTAGVTQAVGILLIDTDPDGATGPTDTYLVVVVHLNA